MDEVRAQLVIRVKLFTSSPSRAYWEGWDAWRCRTYRFGMPIPEPNISGI